MQQIQNDLFDIIIIGGGPIGMACAIEAKKKDLNYLIIEKGCLVNSLYHYPQGMTFFSTSEKLEIGGVPFVSNNVKPVRSESLEYYRRVADNYLLDINLFEEVTGIGKENHYTVETTKSTYKTKNIVLATGFYDIPNKLNIPGEDLPHVYHYYRDPHFYARQKVIVIGANNSSVDAALETYRKGADVTMVIREGGIGERVKYWVRPDIVNRIEEGSIKAHFHSHVIAIRPHEADIQTPDGEVITIPADFVLALIGYQPNFDLLRKMGINLSADGKFTPEHDPETMETNQKGIYLAGVVCGGMDTHVWFIENSREHANKIIKAITEK